MDEGYVFSSVICVLLYFIIGCLTYNFPMPWRDELALFSKVVISGILMMFVATTAGAIYKAYLRKKRKKKVA